MTRAEAEKRGLRILGIWKGYAVKGVPPRVMGIGPAVAIPAVLKQCNLTVDDIDVWEINEAFASQASWCVDILNIDASKVNPNGGAIALGHPLGCTGARQIATLLNELHRRKERFGVVSMCIGIPAAAAAGLPAPTAGLPTATARLPTATAGLPAATAGLPSPAAATPTAIPAAAGLPPAAAADGRPGYRCVCQPAVR